MPVQLPVGDRERKIAVEIVERLRAECGDDLLVALKALALANKMFQTAFASVVNRMSPDRKKEFNHAE